MKKIALIFILLTTSLAKADLVDPHEIKSYYDKRTGSILYTFKKPDDVGSKYFYLNPAIKDSFEALMQKIEEGKESHSSSTQIIRLGLNLQNEQKNSGYFIVDGWKYNDSISALVEFKIYCVSNALPYQECDLDGKINTNLNSLASVDGLPKEFCRSRKNITPFSEGLQQDRFKLGFKFMEGAWVLTKDGTSRMSEYLNKQNPNYDTKICIKGLLLPINYIVNGQIVYRTEFQPTEIRTTQ